MRRVMFSKSKNGMFIVPVFDTILMTLTFSTRNGNAVIDWGDGNLQNYSPPKYTDMILYVPKNNKSYSTAFTGEIKTTIKQGLKDVYSFKWNNVQDNNNTEKLNIQDFKTFINQFPNLYSFWLDFYSYGYPLRQAIIKGDLADVPNSVEKIQISNFNILNNSTDVWFDLSSFKPTSQLKFFKLSPSRPSTLNQLKIIGDVGKLPTSCSFFSVNDLDTSWKALIPHSYISYTAGKIWASSFDTFSIPLPLTLSENDSMLADMANSITTAIGGKLISNKGGRTSSSDAHVAYLESLGFTILIKRVVVPNYTPILNLSFQNNFTDTSPSALTMVAGGTSNQPTFALSGRKAGEYCAVFNGSQSIKTSTNLPLNTTKLTISFWIETAQTTIGYVADTLTNNGFNLYQNIWGGLLALNNINQGNNVVQTPISTFSYWSHIIITVDRTLGKDQSKIYVNGILNFTQRTDHYTNNTGNFINTLLYIGQSRANNGGFVGKLRQFRIYNNFLSAIEAEGTYYNEL